MEDVSNRRRMVARSAIAASLLAVPMTGSICYSTAVAAPADDEQAVAAFLPEIPLAPPAPEAPLTPEAPLAPEPPEAPDVWSDDEREERREELREQRQERQEERREWREERQEEMREARHEARREWEESRKEWAEGRKEWARGREQWAQGRIAYAEGRKQWADGRIQWAEGRKQMAESQVQQALARRDQATMGVHVMTEAELKQIEKSVEIAMKHVPEVIESCRYPDAPVTSIKGHDGRVTMYICETAGDRIALKALKSARAGIASSTHLPEDTRREVLSELDREIAELSS